MKEQQNKSQLYIGIKSPKELRRNILETSKLVILSIQTQAKIIDIQKEKKKLKEQLKYDFKELKLLFYKLEKSLPETAFEENSQTKPSQKKADKEPASDYEEQLEIDKIQRHLEMIEERLRNLK